MINCHGEIRLKGNRMLIASENAATKRASNLYNSVVLSTAVWKNTMGKCSCATETSSF